MYAHMKHLNSLFLYICDVPKALTDDLKYPYIDITCQVPNVFIWIDFKVDVV